MSQPFFDADVAIVGFGPVGTALAGLLAKRGVSVIGIDRDLDVYPLPRAAHIDHQGLRLLQELGCLNELMPRMIPNPGLDFINADGEVLLRIPGSQPSVSGLPASMYFHQPPFDRQLRATVARMPTVDVRLGVEVTALEAFSDYVVLDVLDDRGVVSQICTRWAVGCDGAWSSVREIAGIPLESLNFDEQWVVVDLVLKQEIPALPDRALNVCDPARPTTAVPIPDGRFRFEVMVLPGENPEELQKPENILPVLARWVPAESVEVERAAVYTFHGLLADPWRVGRVLIAGDAAHQMPPFLGQGMNSGLRDAANLAWKLAMVVCGQADSSLVDTYGLERRPHVREIIVSAIAYGRMTCTLDPVEAAERDHRLRSDPRPLTARIPFSLPPLRKGPLVRHGGGELFVQPAPDASGVRLDDVIGSRFLVLGRTASQVQGGVGDWWAEHMGALVTTLDELPDFAGYLEPWLERRSAEVVIVRPDRYVMAAGTDLGQLTREVSGYFEARELQKVE
jgi:3-(3-hydroxy-phenyl)propionate hydroxylase